ncbi:CsbD family protein [Pseudomonas solani]|uniref:CsbD family protein n=1 Tax=Pseudomonas solani TaxID=2731552 RepID=A0AAU7Y8L6_9PSED
MSLLSADHLQGMWKQQIGAAKIAWGNLTEDELLRTEGQTQRLAGLLQERYAISRDEADQQVKDFLEKNKC